MATLGQESARPHSQLGSPSTQSGISNLPPSRGLERALEEAASSGALSLSARKLKEFPRTAVNHDLTDTVEADLSKNRLTEVPSEVCHLVALETLNLYHNCIRTIPDSFISLQSLTCLNLSRNQLGALPACLCGLPLRVLNASNNKLVSLPETIGQLQSLMELDISCNEITALPRHIGRLKALRELNVRRNLLCVLPEGSKWKMSIGITDGSLSNGTHCNQEKAKELFFLMIILRSHPTLPILTDCFWGNISAIIKSEHSQSDQGQQVIFSIKGL
ncbi:leucine-rich repeat and calponin homology domain-containing protein 1-like [Lampris incognitus]|uniref:leucine-rich repeat and calponin homology domain-containing protein 1-like n=1 Tax=Lampris incognitus TaxID=2546036 RepID=UPI0024B615A5|nr:leucine-rich repeat and calponin homology domain-containing protein 1-like [Lampris incognitus]